MWGDLTGRLKATDFKATLKAVGDAVAPPAEDDVLYSDEDGEYEDEEDEYEDEQDSHAQQQLQQQQQQHSPSRFGLVGMLAKKLVQQEEDDDDDESYEDDEEFEDEDIDEDEEEVLDLQGPQDEAAVATSSAAQAPLFEDYDAQASSEEATATTTAATASDAARPQIAITKKSEMTASSDEPESASSGWTQDAWAVDSSRSGAAESSRERVIPSPELPSELAAPTEQAAEVDPQPHLSEEPSLYDIPLQSAFTDAPPGPETSSEVKQVEVPSPELPSELEPPPAEQTNEVPEHDALSSAAPEASIAAAAVTATAVFHSEQKFSPPAGPLELGSATASAVAGLKSPPIGDSDAQPPTSPHNSSDSSPVMVSDDYRTEEDSFERIDIDSPTSPFSSGEASGTAGQATDGLPAHTTEAPATEDVVASGATSTQQASEDDPSSTNMAPRVVEFGRSEPSVEALGQQAAEDEPPAAAAFGVADDVNVSEQAAAQPRADTADTSIEQQENSSSSSDHSVELRPLQPQSPSDDTVESRQTAGDRSSQVDRHRLATVRHQQQQQQHSAIPSYYEQSAAEDTQSMDSGDQGYEEDGDDARHEQRHREQHTAEAVDSVPRDEELRSRLDMLTAANEALHDAIASQEEEHRRRLEELAETNASLASANNAREDDRRRLEEALAAANTAAESAAAQAAAAQDTINSLQSQLVAATDQLYDAQRSHTNAVADLERQHEARIVQFHEQVLRAQAENHQAEIAEQVRARGEAQEQLAQALARLDDRESTILQLEERVAHMEAAVTDHQDGMDEAEEEMDELHSENETLHKQNEKLESQNALLLKQIKEYKDQLSSVDGLHMELTMLREARDRERNNASATQASVRQLEAARDAALSEAQELRHSLAAANADRDVAKADADRAVMANANLQQALAAFQDERQAELDMIAAQHTESLEAAEAAAQASREALTQVHAREMKQVQAAGDAAVQNCMKEIQSLEETIAKQRMENVQLRRSLDEAISRLQSNQEDVVDRTVMKNIILDWCTVTDRDRRHQILQLLASMLHFNESEREKVHVSSHTVNLGGRIVTAIAPSLPPPRQSEIAGENVREKWVNFLLSEIDDEDGGK